MYQSTSTLVIIDVSCKLGFSQIILDSLTNPTYLRNILQLLMMVLIQHTGGLNLSLILRQKKMSEKCNM